jgi:hypothetical protein
MHIVPKTFGSCGNVTVPLPFIEQMNVSHVTQTGTVRNLLDITYKWFGIDMNTVSGTIYTPKDRDGWESGEVFTLDPTQLEGLSSSLRTDRDYVSTVEKIGDDDEHEGLTYYTDITDEQDDAGKKSRTVMQMEDEIENADVVHNKIPSVYSIRVKLRHRSYQPHSPMYRDEVKSLLVSKDGTTPKRVTLAQVMSRTAAGYTLPSGRTDKYVLSLDQVRYLA